jgi:hypothetical protein
MIDSTTHRNFQSEGPMCFLIFLISMFWKVSSRQPCRSITCQKRSLVIRNRGLSLPSSGISPTDQARDSQPVISVTGIDNIEERSRPTLSRHEREMLRASALRGGHNEAWTVREEKRTETRICSGKSSVVLALPLPSEHIHRPST